MYHTNIESTTTPFIRTNWNIKIYSSYCGHMEINSKKKQSRKHVFRRIYEKLNCLQSSLSSASDDEKGSLTFHRYLNSLYLGLESGWLVS